MQRRVFTKRSTLQELKDDKTTEDEYYTGGLHIVVLVDDWEF